jgi:hypothetical protein
MDNILKTTKLENILLSKWTEFLDVRKLLAFIMKSVRDTKDLIEIEEETLPQKNTELTLSKFSINQNGFLIWADFTIPKEKGFAIGTCEICLNNNGNLKLIRCVGHILKQR